MRSFVQKGGFKNLLPAGVIGWVRKTGVKTPMSFPVVYAMTFGCLWTTYSRIYWCQLNNRLMREIRHEFCRIDCCWPHGRTQETKRRKKFLIRLPGGVGCEMTETAISINFWNLSAELLSKMGLIQPLVRQTGIMCTSLCNFGHNTRWGNNRWSRQRANFQPTLAQPTHSRFSFNWGSY